MDLNNALIHRCLAYGIEILPYQLEYVLQQYEIKKIPDEYLNKMPKTNIINYVRGLYLSAQEMAGDWSRGHDLLKEIGFTENRKENLHRVFISLEFKPTTKQ